MSAPDRATGLYRADRGSFRDRHGVVFLRDGAVYRALSAQALAEWQAVSRAEFFQRYTGAGRIARTWEVDASDFAVDGDQRWAGLLQHEPVPFVSYPYEWSFGMLKDAALLQLELLVAALGAGFTLKDASPFNVQWNGTQPVFVDIPSFRRLGPGEPWIGYRQFCEMFLYPLLLQAYKDVPFQPWLRGHIDGIDARHVRRLMSARDLVRPGVLTHVYLHAAFQQQAGGSERDLRGELRAAGFDRELIAANARRLQRLVRKLRWTPSRSEWSEYGTEHRYTEGEVAEKTAFVREVVGSGAWRLVWDLGCNTGTFSRIAAEHARHVVAMDADVLAVERLYTALAGTENRAILPLVIDLADPSPALGWRGAERKTLSERGRPDLTLCLALVHHLAIGANIPLDDLLDWLAELRSQLVIEFVTPEDPMVQRLLRNKDADHGDYDLAVFERCLGARFEVVRRRALASGTRLLYHARPRA